MNEVEKAKIFQSMLNVALSGNHLMEKLAEIEHQKWVSFVDLLHHKGKYNEAGEWVIPKTVFEMWQTLQHTAYDDLQSWSKDDARRDALKKLAEIKKFFDVA